MKEKIVLAPQKGPQEMFLATSADICIYGGAAGGGKTFAVIRRHLGEIADELGGNIADKLSEVFANMPVSSTKGA